MAISTFTIGDFGFCACGTPLTHQNQSVCDTCAVDSPQCNCGAAIDEQTAMYMGECADCVNYDTHSCKACGQGITEEEAIYIGECADCINKDLAVDIHAERTIYNAFWESMKAWSDDEEEWVVELDTPTWCEAAQAHLVMQLDGMYDIFGELIASSHFNKLTRI